jgi:hypothetical protein
LPRKTVVSAFTFLPSTISIHARHMSCILDLDGGPEIAWKRIIVGRSHRGA